MATENAAKQCPYFDICNQNNCPLAPNFPNLKSFPEDKGNNTCKLTKRKRMLIALKNGLENNGLFNRESPKSKFCIKIIQDFKADQAKPQEKEVGSKFIWGKIVESSRNAIVEEGREQEKAE